MLWTIFLILLVLWLLGLGLGAGWIIHFLLLPLAGILIHKILNEKTSGGVPWAGFPNK